MRKDNFLTPSAELKFENTSGNDWSIFRLNSGKKWFATRYNKANKQPDEYRADVRYSSPEVLKFNHDRAIKIIQSVIGISEKYGIVNSNGIQKVFDWRIRYPKKYEDVYNLINEDMIPGGLSDGMDISDIASHHSVDISVIEKELEKGMKVELEHTSDEKIAKEIAIDHLYEDPKYYTKLSTIEENTVKYLQKSLGVSREKMPQISSSDVHNYVEYLRKHGVNVKGSSIPISKIGMTQKDINTEKVKALLGTEVHNLSKPVIISKDNYILDGHHRVVALYNIDNNFKLKTIKVNLPIQKLLDITHGYPKVSYKTIHENIRFNSNKKVNSEIQEGSDIGTLGGGNNSARWTPPGKSKKLGIEQLSGYIQKDFPVADSMDISGEKDHWMSSSVNAKFHNKVRAKRDISGNLVLEGIGDKLEAKYGVEADVYEYGDYIELSKVVVPKDKRGSGIGTKFMEDLIKYAESTNKDIFLTPSSDFGGSKGRLIQFYKGFGFKPNSGKHRDFRSRNTMVLHTEGKMGGMITESGSLPGVIPIPANLADPIIKDFIKNIVIPSKAVDPDTITGLGSTRQILKNLPGAKKIAGDLDLVAVATVDRKAAIADLTSKAKSMGLDYQIAFGNVFSVGYPFKGNKYQVDLMVSEASDDNSVYNYMVKFRYWSDESGEQNTPFTLKGAHRSELTRTIIKAVGLSATERGFSEFKWNDKYDTVDKLSDELNKKADKFRDETKKRETKEVASLIKNRLGDIKRLRNLLADRDGIIINRYPHSLFKNLPLGYEVLTDVLFDKIEGRDNWEKLLDKKFGITNTLERMRKFDDVVDLIKELLKKKVLTPTSVVYAFREMKKNFNTGKAAGNWNSDLENYIEKSFGFLKNRW
jgi:GNAT superfamily N-acetyltransferase